jgi:hypothetical protein
VPAEAERTRVARHIARAEKRARAAAPPLTRAQQIVRALLLDELGRYRRARRFPKNPGLPRTPIFVDAEGTRCAMAALLELGGASALVARIAAKRNFDRVARLADVPELVAWLDAAGIAVAEAAAIQPAYEACETTAMCLCQDRPGPTLPADGVIEAIVTAPYVGRVTAVYGDVGQTRVGDELCVDEPRPRATALVPTPHLPAGILVDLDAGSCASSELPLTVTLAGGRPAACSFAPLDALPMTEAQAVAALRANDCVGSLAAVDPRWGCGCIRWDGFSDVRSCSPTTAGGCTTSPAAETPQTVSILLAVVSALAARKVLRRAAFQ